VIRLIKQIGSLTAVACSGGVDSMAVLNFIYNANPNIVAIYFHHGTSHGDEAQKFLTDYCNSKCIKLIIGSPTSLKKPPDESWEEFWRNQRYAFFASLDHCIATAHHLNDVAETYLWGCIHGKPRFIHYRCPLASNVVRPFLLTEKTKLLNWCNRHKVPFIEDESNNDIKYDRNRIRHKILPEVLKVNPGFLKVVRRQLESSLEF
jgi:tRNA(Ile)-lysidine synthase